MKEYKYQSEYERTRFFWDKRPAKFVRIFAEYLNFQLHGKKILDLGAGEGKNAVYIASLGGSVIAVDSSSLALSRFQYQPNYPESKERIKTQIIDINLVDFPSNSFDVIIAYGVLHCLETKREVLGQVKKIQRWTKKNGYFVGCAFTNEIPVPTCQPYLNEDSFLDKGELKSLFNDWKIIAYEDDVIIETHPTSKIEHSHSLSRILAEKI